MRAVFTWLGCAGILALVSVLFAVRGFAPDERAVARCCAIQLESATLARLAKEASLGSAPAFDGLQASRDRIDANVQRLLDAGPEPAATERVLQSWRTMRAATDSILAQRSGILRAHDVAARIEAQIPPLQQRFERMARIAVDVSAPANHVYLLDRHARLVSRLPRLLRQISDVENSDWGVDGGIWGLSRDVDFYRLIVKGLAEGSSEMALVPVTDGTLAALLDDSSADFEAMAAAIEELEPLANDWVAAQETAAGIEAQATGLAEALARVE